MGRQKQRLKVRKTEIWEERTIERQKDEKAERQKNRKTKIERQNDRKIATERQKRKKAE